MKSNNVMEEAWRKALSTKNNDNSKDIDSYVWKKASVKGEEQETVKMLDMTPEELQYAYQHCNKMLNSTNPKHLGRYNVKKEVYDQIHKCTIELFIRFCENTYRHDPNKASVDRGDLWLTLNKFKENNPEIDTTTKVIGDIIRDLPTAFQELTIEDVMDGCLKEIGAFNKSRLTITFITKLGVWLTKAEETEFSNVSTKDRLTIIKDRLHIPAALNIRFNANGLSTADMKSMLNIRNEQRYSDLTNDQLVILKDVVLPRYIKEVNRHISYWNKLLAQIKTVARKRKINLINE